MTVKPTYEELEQRIQELEKIESEHAYFKKALQENEGLFRMLYEKAPLGYQSLDENGRFIVVNQTWLDTLGYDREDVIGKSFADFLHPDWRDHFKENFPRFKSIGEILGVEFEMVKKDGTLILVSFTGKITRDKTGNFQQTHCIFHDITDRKRVEEALRQSEEKYRVLFNTFPLGITVSDHKGNIVESNAMAEKLLGLAKNKHEERRLDGDQWRIIRPDKTRMPTDEYASVRALKKKRQIENVEMGIVKPDGRITWINVSAAPLNLEKYGVVVTYGDITARKKAEQEYKTLFREMLDGFALHEIICDDSKTPVDYRFLDINPAFERMTGLKAASVVGRTVMDVLPTTESYWIETYGAVALSGEPITFENYSAEIGKHFEVTAFCPAPGQFACIFQDITERKRAEADRDVLQTQLNQAQRMESVGRLAGGVAHDFNNMLGVILGHAELALLRADENHDLHDDLKEIQNAAQRSADITKQLLAFARKQTISPKQLDINDTVESMLNMLRRLIGEDIDLVWQPAAHVWPVKMDPTQIDQILANLCVNAMDAISGVGKLTIETGRKTFDEDYCNDHQGFIPGDYTLLAVSDNGCGMDKDTLENLFEPFFTTKEVGKGTGLGLATVYGIVRQNNGFINVYSEPGQGATFSIYLPRFVDDDPADTAVSEKKTAAGGTETILLVEDEPSILRMTRIMLERKGYTVLSAVTPAEAMEKAKNHAGAIDLLITDVVMPEMNGRDLARQITALYPGIRLLFMSGYTANVIAHQGRLDEGVAFIQKPFSMADITAKARELLDMAPDSGKSG
ncbi:PAS domain S-box protein [Desulfotignum phosphitoxidans]|uniref:histidine kinase n=1 Tax=Desulfotignum phosphitoxidans DSM 13687 TaxID=1286635 RepID=S0G2V0_9BACT|nr:PAS domain S-box protein [Desulfotignum phosphitoxidans]EMS79789.1 signal transduction histidine kinase PtdJ [Desulfotignum phosphitoxidans DSM 13687]